MPVVVLFLIFVALLVIAVPVSITLGITSVLPSVFDPSFTVGAKYLIRAMFGGLDSFPLLAVPMFVLSGIIMAKGGISKKLFDVFAYFLGKFTAGMPCAVIVTCLFYGAISGSAPATVAAVGSMTIPILHGSSLCPPHTVCSDKRHKPSAADRSSDPVQFRQGTGH